MCFAPNDRATIIVGAVRIRPPEEADVGDRRDVEALRYRRIRVLLRREGWNVNAKRVYRLYKELGLQLLPAAAQATEATR